ncbi:phospholipase D-like domain-containing protein [Gracilimonas mengyeensis]|uniref:phospholipase D n=1 Tax=Gracilimonas mengyeensis TaxID=1302730 RepID=A0A521DJP9_9BACT|nr:phospholipase D family protein [Gracilimonas mengyeensis]SMO71150.1 PLD-like domain-containing protein [Gracilimonas mengyeensis]
MYQNGVSADIYIGQGAGTMVDKDLKNAEKSVKIVSPFLSPSLVKQLITLWATNKSVTLITNDRIEDYSHRKDKNIYTLIRQIRTTHHDAVEKKEQYQNTAQVLFYVLFGYLAFLIASYIVFLDERLSLALIPFLILILVHRMFVNKAKNTRIFSYRYETLFPIKICQPDHEGSNKNGDNFKIHSKIFIIDDKVAYVGSLNFTQSGFKYNHETRVKVTDAEAIRKINTEFEELYHNPNLGATDIQRLGRKLYPEPIN